MSQQIRDITIKLSVDIFQRIGSAEVKGRQV